MAKRSKRNYGMKKMEPAPTRWTLATASIPAGTFDGSGNLIEPGRITQFFDCSQIASLLNRRFYRQGLGWVIGNITVLSQSNMQGGLTISTMPTTWPAYQAYKAAFQAWNRQQMEAVEESGAESAVAAFRDFKVYLDTDHVAAGFGANLLPTDSQGNNPILGEWEASQIVIPNAGAPGTNDERFLHLVGTNFNNPGASRGIIEGYADSRAFPQSPDPVSPNLDSTNNWMSQMFDVGDNIGDVLDNATDRNDNLPYDQINYPGGETNMPATQIMDFGYITSTTIGGTTRFQGGIVPCGLVRLDLFNETNTAQNVILQFDVASGTHRGYMCEKMLEA